MPDTPVIIPDFVHEANAEQARAEAVKFLAEAAQAQAEATKALYEGHKFEAEADEAETKAAKARIELDREEHKRRKELAADEFHHRYLFDSPVGEDSVKKCIRQLSDWERCAPDGQSITVELVINSPGGEIFSGFALVDYVTGMFSRGHVVNTTAYGMAASMGGVLLQIGQTRRMGASAALLIHEAQFRTGGKTGDVEDEMLLVHMLQDRILDIYAARAANSAAEHPMSRATIKKRWARRDWWINATDCLKFGFIDEVC